MKNFWIVILAFAPQLASASVCSHFNGQFIDELGHKQILKASADCKTLTWKSGEESNIITTDSLDRKVSQAFAPYNLFIKASYVNDHELTLDYRLQDAEGSILSQSRSEYQIAFTDLVRLTETNYSVGADGKSAQISQKVLFQVHSIF